MLFPAPDHETTDLIKIRARITLAFDGLEINHEELGTYICRYAFVTSFTGDNLTKRCQMGKNIKVLLTTLSGDSLLDEVKLFKFSDESEQAHWKVATDFRVQAFDVIVTEENDEAYG